METPKYMNKKTGPTDKTQTYWKIDDETEDRQTDRQKSQSLVYSRAFDNIRSADRSRLFFDARPEIS